MTDEEEKDGLSVNRGARPSTEQSSTMGNSLENLPLENFPDEILIHVLSWLNQRDVSSVISVDEHFKELMNGNLLWYRYAQRAWTIVGEDYSPEKDYKALIKEHCTPSFTLLGDETAGSYLRAHGISANGSTVVGKGLNNDGSWSIFLWTKEGGMKPLEALKNFYYTEVGGISADGRTIFGSCQAEEGKELQVFRYTKGRINGLEILENLKGWGRNFPCSASEDGSTLVGYLTPKIESFSTSIAFLWTQGEGIRPLEGLNEVGFSRGTGISAEGSVITGDATESSTRSPLRAFQYRHGEGIQFLDHLPNHNVSTATAISADGLVIVGCSAVAEGEEGAVKWTREDKVQSLPKLNEGEDSIALAVNADGSRIVGWVGSAIDHKAALWEGGKEIQLVEDILKDKGVFPAGWILEVNAITPDGAVLLGTAKREGELISRDRAWRGVIPRYNLF
jgi:uncharacterized membrane protein